MENNGMLTWSWNCTPVLSCLSLSLSLTLSPVSLLTETHVRRKGKKRHLLGQYREKGEHDDLSVEINLHLSSPLGTELYVLLLPGLWRKTLGLLIKYRESVPFTESVPFPVFKTLDNPGQLFAVTAIELQQWCACSISLCMCTCFPLFKCYF